jgi:hypothetical protein
MAKQLKDIIKKAKSDSKLVPNRVSDMLKPGDEKRFAAKHLIQKHADRNGNDTGVFDAGDVHYDLNFKDEKRHGRKRGEDEKVYEAVEKENTKCNESAKGVMCEVHGMNDCKKAKPLTEDEEDEREAGQHYSKDTTAPSAGKASKSPSNKMKQDTVSSGTDAGKGSKSDEPSKPAKPSPMAEAEGDDDDMEMMKKSRQAINTENDPDKKEKLKQRHEKLASTFNRIPEEVELDEVLTKKTPAGEWIRDFVDSDNPKFEGKSKQKRTQMALAAYYSKQGTKKN